MTRSLGGGGEGVGDAALAAGERSTTQTMTATVSPRARHPPASWLSSSSRACPRPPLCRSLTAAGRAWHRMGSGASLMPALARDRQ